MTPERTILNIIKRENPDNPLAYAHNIVRDFAKEKLEQQILACQDCEISSFCKSLPFGKTDADVMIIGEAISEQQINDGKVVHHPLEGTRGYEMLKTVLDYYHVNHNELFYMNAVSCFPHKVIDDKILPRTPSKKEVDGCKVFLEYAIDIVRPSLIILLGSIALNVFKKGAISKERGQWLTVKGIPAMPTYHPEYFVQIEGKKHPDIVEELKIDFQEDIKNAFLYIQDNYPDNNILLEKIEEEL